MTVIQYGSEAWELRKTEEDLLDVFHINCLRIALGTRLTDGMFNSKLYKKCGSISLSRTILRERMRLLGYTLRQTTDDRLPKIVLVSKPSRAKR